MNRSVIVQLTEIILNTTPLHPFCTSSISTSMNIISVKKPSNIQVVGIQITLQDGHHLLNYNEIHEKLQAFVSSDNQSSDNRGQGCIVSHIQHITVFNFSFVDNYLSSLIFSYYSLYTLL